ncbi:MAG: YncE family protein [Gammaproteobacteria bacterium]|nr:YncE family protein [Gammaproteobacteria bacterium]
MKGNCFAIIISFILINGSSFAEPIMYVPTGNTNELLIIDLASDKIIGSIGELENAHGLAGNANSEYLIAGSMGLNKGKSNKPSSVNDDEHQAHHQSSKNSAKTSDQRSYISIIHPQHGHVMRRIEVDGISHHTAISPDGHYAAATHSQNGTVSIIDLQTFKVIKLIKTGQVPNYAGFTSDGHTLYISNAGSATLSNINTSSWEVEQQIKVGKGPEHFTISKNGKRIYILNVVEGTVSEVDIKTSKVTRNFNVGKSPHGLALSKNEQALFVANKASDNLIKIDLDHGSQQQLSLKHAPYHVEFIASVGKLYVSSRKQPLIWVIDPDNLQIKKELQLGKGVAHQMVVIN